MALFDKLFGSKSHDDSVKVRRSHENITRLTGDKYEKTPGGGHVHRGYNTDTSSGSHREYGGGENSPDRSYNKK